MPLFYQNQELTKENVISIIREIDSDLEGVQRKLKLYCLGGTKLVLTGLRSISKDIDFIVSREDLLAVGGPMTRIEWQKKIRIDVFPDGELPNYRYPSCIANAKKLPLHFNHLEIYLLDDADFVLTKALAGRSTDYEDIETLLSGKNQIPQETLRERFKNIKPTKGKDIELKGKFEKFISEYYKS
jgi:hypothetical protein